MTILPMDLLLDRSPMELFILALIGRLNLSTLYEFRQKAGLEPGAIRLALERLEKAELITRSASGRRMRRNLALTTLGSAMLKEHWTRSLVPHSDAESVLRAAFLALAMAEPGRAISYLAEAAEDRRRKAQEKGIAAGSHPDRAANPLSVYLWMRAATEARRLHAEQEVFASISGRIEQRLMEDGRRPDAAAIPRSKSTQTLRASQGSSARALRNPPDTDEEVQRRN